MNLNKALQAVTISDNTELKTSTISNDFANISTLARTIVTNSQTEQRKLYQSSSNSNLSNLLLILETELTAAVSNNSNSTIEVSKAILNDS